MTRATTSEHSSEAGFTLLEVIISIVITGIIIVVIGFSVTESLSNSTITKQSIDRSTLADLAASAFARDVANSTNDPPPSTTCGTGTLAIALPIDSTTSIEYVVDAGTQPGTFALYRRQCAGATQTDQQRLGQTTDAFSATTPSPPCDATGVCTLDISWSASPAYSFTLSGNRRINT